MTATALEVKKRSEVSSNDCWNVDSIFRSLDEWENTLKKVVESPTSPHWPSVQPFRGRLSEGPEKIKEALTKILEISRHLEKLYTYAHLRHDEEITNDANKMVNQRISSLMQDFSQEISWFEPELLSLPENKINEALNSPSLSSYRFYLEKILRMCPHTLSAELEQLLAMAGKPLQSTQKAFSALNNADIKFGTVKDSANNELPLSHGLYQIYLRSSDRVLRENAFKALHKKFEDFENTLCELIYGQVQNHAFYAKARNFSSSLEASLFPKNIDTSVYHSLIQAVREEGIPTLHRYMALRKKILNLPELHLYDIYTPLVPATDFQMEYPEAEKLVVQSVAQLGNDYQNLLKKGMIEDRWVDRYENTNKRSGAYSSGCYDTSPFILMNYKGALRDVFTLAHEAGHSMHSLLSNKNQPYHYSHYPIFVAEVASTFNEELLMDLLLKTRQKNEEKLFLINEKIEDIRATLFRQTMFSEFELRIHEEVEKGTPLTPTFLKNIYLQLNKEYFGPDVVIDQDIAIEWARIPHFYYNFYVFQYATGISAAIALSHRILSGDTQARDQYLTFLKSGSSQFPLDLLKTAGVDMTSPTPVREALNHFKTLVDDLEKLTKK